MTFRKTLTKFFAYAILAFDVLQVDYMSLPLRVSEH